MNKSESDILLSVIIVSYNCLLYLQNTIGSIWQYNDIGEKLEIIVVDNSTNNETMTWLVNNKPHVTAIKNENRGFGQGNNVGAKVARGRYLLFLNPDTLLIEPIFKWAILQMENDEQLGVFGVRLLKENMKKNWSFGLRMPMGSLRTTISNICGALDIFIPELMFTCGADIFMPKVVFEKIGGFDENIFMYCEEADICNRINRIGMNVAYFPKHKLIHYEGKASDFNLYQKYVNVMVARKYYCQKYNIDFKKFGKRERRYCRFKGFVAGLSGNRERKEQFQMIDEYWKNELNK